ncbi:MAG: hypothetical protein L0219_13765 [Phycisphaerales bacterium]|nr:hypothetical protein [Phycisphaerales bacterium]
MADLLEQGSAWLEDQRNAHMTRAVVYQRSGENVELPATIGRTVFEQADEFGIIHKLESRDFLLLRTDLVLSGVQTLPKAGDRVRDPDGDDTQVYEVMAPGGEPPFRYSDPYRKTLRIHTKHIATEAVT